MVKIRSEQMETFQVAAEAGFVERLVERVREKQSETIVRLPSGSLKVREIPDAQLREMVKNGIARARLYEMRWERSIAKFVALMFMKAPNFDSHPPIQRLLNDPQVDAESRLDSLWGNISREDWSAISDGYDVNAWQLRAGGHE